MEWFYSTFEEPVNVALKRANIINRPLASPGTWLSFLLPSAVVLGSIRNPEAAEQYHVTAVVATGMFGAAAALLLHLIHASRTDGISARAFSALYFVPSALTTILLIMNSQKGIIFSLFGGLVSTFPFCMGVLIVMQLLPGSFSYGEASCIVQGIVLFLFSAVTNLSTRVNDIHLDAMEKSTAILQVGLLGLGVICICVAMYPGLRDTRPFCGLIVGVMGGLVVPALYIIMHENPVLWIIHYILDDLQRVYLMVYWVVCSGVAIMAVCTQVQDSHQASTAVRKTFHLLVLAVYLPGIAWECTLMHLASGIAFAALILTEVVRLLQVGTLGENLQQGFLVFADEKDGAGIALTPLYLLVGCSVPLWLHPTRCALRANVALPMMSGLLSVGVGDTAASIVGSACGKHKWPGSMKSKEGTIACIIAQLCIIVLLVYVGFLPLTVYTVLRATFAVVAISIAEAVMDQVDNLVLPLLMYILLI